MDPFTEIDFVIPILVHKIKLYKMLIRIKQNIK